MATWAETGPILHWQELVQVNHLQATKMEPDRHTVKIAPRNLAPLSGSAEQKRQTWIFVRFSLSARQKHPTAERSDNHGVRRRPGVKQATDTEHTKRWAAPVPLRQLRANLIALPRITQATWGALEASLTSHHRWTQLQLPVWLESDGLCSGKIESNSRPLRTRDQLAGHQFVWAFLRATIGCKLETCQTSHGSHLRWYFCSNRAWARSRLRQTQAYWVAVAPWQGTEKVILSSQGRSQESVRGQQTNVPRGCRLPHERALQHRRAGRSDHMIKYIRCLVS